MPRQRRNASPESAARDPAAGHGQLPVTPGDDSDWDEQEGVLRPSKSQLKRDMTRLQALGEQFAALPQDHIERCPIPDTLREAVLTYRKTRSHEGRRRQMQYIGKLMRQSDPAPIEAAVLAMQAGQARDTLALHQAERWRDALLDDDDATTRWLAEHPDTDTQQLRSLIRAARKDRAAPGPEGGHRQSRAFRELFQFIKPYLAPAAATDADDATMH